jgi:hypothetical protein
MCYIYINQVHTSIDLPMHLHSTKFGCIRAFDEAENEASQCQQIEYIANGTYMASTVYDFDSNAMAWNKIKNVSLIMLSLLVLKLPYIFSCKK